MTALGYRPAAALSGKRLSYWVKEAAEDVFAYIVIEDERAKGRDLECYMLIAPPLEPDGRVDRMLVNWRVHLGSSWDAGNEFFEAVVARVRLLEPSLCHLGEAVAAQLADPPLRSKYLDRYLAYRSLYRGTEPSRLESLLHEMNAVVSGAAKFGATEKTGLALASSLLDEAPSSLPLCKEPWEVSGFGTVLRVYAYRRLLVAADHEAAVPPVSTSSDPETKRRELLQEHVAAAARRGKRRVRKKSEE